MGSERSKALGSHARAWTNTRTPAIEISPDTRAARVAGMCSMDRATRTIERASPQASVNVLTSQAAADR